MTTKTILLACFALAAFGFSYYQIAVADGVEPQPYTTLMGVPNANNSASLAPNTDIAAGVTWMTWDEAVKANKKSPKKMIVDVYTDWCGWCKRMDATTFKDPKVAAYIAEHFYAVKLDAEQEADIVYDGVTFSFQRQGKRGVHGLAASILDNRLSYPSVVYFNGNMERIMISPGYKDADKMLQELMYANGETSAP